MLDFPLNQLRNWSNLEFRNLRRLLKEAEVDAKLRPDYSGRAMYGEHCMAIYLSRGTTESTVLATVLEELIDNALRTAYIAGGNEVDDDENEDKLMIAKILFMMKQARTDSMGVGSVVYFPGVTAEDNGAPDDEDDEEGDDGE